MECAQVSGEVSSIDWAGIGGLAAGGGALISAALAALTVRNSRRSERARIFLQVAPPLPNDERVEVIIHNRGVGVPVLMTFSVSDRAVRFGGGGPVEPPHPGANAVFDIPRGVALAGCRLEVAWVDQDGSRHSIKRWYQITGDDQLDQRTDLKLEGKLSRVMKLVPLDRRPPRRATVSSEVPRPPK